MFRVCDRLPDRLSLGDKLIARGLIRPVHDLQHIFIRILVDKVEHLLQYACFFSSEMGKQGWNIQKSDNRYTFNCFLNIRDRYVY